MVRKDKIEYPSVIRDHNGEVIFTTDTHHYDDACLRNANLSGQMLMGLIAMHADFGDADLRDANLYWASLSFSNFQNADLRGAKLNGASLSEADFRYAKLQGADLGKDNLGGSTDIEKTLFDCAEYDRFTILPESFDPDAAGMILIGAK